MRMRWIREKASNCEVSLAPRRPEFERGLGDPLQPRLVERAGDDLEPADDRGQQIVEIVGDAAGELADRLHLLRLAQRLLGALALADLGLEPVERGAQIGGALGDPRLEHLGAQFPFGDVVGDADEADMLAVRAPARLRDRAQPAPFAVAAAEARLEHEGLERGLAGDRFGLDARLIVGMDDVRASHNRPRPHR